MSDPLMQELAARKPRAGYTFPISPALQEADGVAAFTLVKLTIEEEQQVQELAMAAPASLNANQAIFSLRAVNERPVNRGDGSADKALSDMDPKTRVLVASAFAHIHGHRREDIEVFLKGCKVTSG